MNAYFERIHSFKRNNELPPRIHFMLIDVIELRENKVRSV